MNIYSYKSRQRKIDVSIIQDFRKLSTSNMTNICFTFKFGEQAIIKYAAFEITI